MILLTAALLRGRQIYPPPDVLLPSGWRVEYGKRQGKAVGLLLGPRREEIDFAAFSASFDAADAVHHRDPTALFDRAFLGGRTVEATLEGDGTLTLSFGQRLPHEHDSDQPASYRTHVETAREAGLALGLVLSRLDASNRNPNRDQGQKRSPDRSAPLGFLTVRSRFGWASLPQGYTYQDTTPPSRPYGQFECPGRPTILERHDAGEAQVNDPKDGGPLPMWMQFPKVLGGTLCQWGTEDRRFAIRFDADPSKGIDPRFPDLVVLQGTPDVAVVAILARLSYTPEKP